MINISCDVLVIGAGIVGISSAYYIKKLNPANNVILVDSGEPMAFTSAQSGENYRNWWPHPVMTAFTDRSIDLMEEIAIETDNLINLNRRGYVLATRSDDIDSLLDELAAGYAESPVSEIRLHESLSSNSYQSPLSGDWEAAPSGVDVLRNPKLIRSIFPNYDKDIRSIVHIRRAGSLSGQQLGQHMLTKFNAAGGKQLKGNVASIEQDDGFRVYLGGYDRVIQAESIVNAAGPFINKIANMLGKELPIKNTLQQKIAFEDSNAMIPRNMPFSIDLDEQFIDWTEEEKALLNEDQDLVWLTQQMSGAIHCRPDGGDNGSWVKLGWAFNETSVKPEMQPALTDTYPEIVLRGAARLNPGLKTYYGRLPRNMHHYGGYYTLTEENWPLIGEMEVSGAYVVGAMSGFGSMAACAGGELCARWVIGLEKPEYAPALSPERHKDSRLMDQLKTLSSRGIL